MNPILKCCGYYCACLAILGTVFFAILIVIVDNENPYLVKGQSEEQLAEKIHALIVAIFVNAACFVLCVGCVCIGRLQEAKLAKLEEEKDKDINMPVRNKEL